VAVWTICKALSISRNEGRQYLLKPCSGGCIDGLAERLLHAGELQFGKHQDLPNGIVQLETQPLSFLGSHPFSNVIGILILAVHSQAGASSGRRARDTRSCYAGKAPCASGNPLETSSGDL
jgi:hypothetical protein